MSYLLIDAHLDLAWNMLTFGRDYTRSVGETRLLEAGSLAPQHNGDTLLGWHEFQRGRVGLVFATLFASPARRRLGEWDRLCYADAEEAHQIYRRQLEAYHRLVERHPEKFTLIQTQTELERHLAAWQAAPDEIEIPNLPVGMVILMENAEGVRTPGELAQWWEGGVRIIGPAWAGTRFCGGTREPGGLTAEGYALLEGMAEHGFVLDLSHMDEAAVYQALDTYPGVIIASHSTARALHNNPEFNRNLTDRMIAGILERQGVIGIVPANWFLKPDWKDSGGRLAVDLSLVAAQIDYICQMAGDSRHVGIGSDYDGGFGLQSVPVEIDSTADLQKIAGVLAGRGYDQQDIENIFHNNWLGVLRRALPE